MPKPSEQRRQAIAEGRRLAKAGDHAAAARHLRRADGIRPLGRTALLTLARALGASGNVPAVMAMMPRLLNEPSLFRGAGRLVMKLREWVVAVEVWQKLLERGPDLEASLQLARAFTHMGRLPEAVEAARQVLDLDPRHHEAAMLASQALRTLERDAAASASSVLPLAAMFHGRDASKRTPEISHAASAAPEGRAASRRRARVRHFANGFFREAEGDVARAFIAFRNAHHLAPDEDSTRGVKRTRSALIRQLSSDATHREELFHLLQTAGVLVGDDELESLLHDDAGS